MKRLLLLITLMIGCVLLVDAANKKFTLVIDAGHGGHDAGAIGHITKEKTINLNVALAFGRLVEQNCPDVKVIYTRKTDVFVPLHTRADIANHNKADLFISIHTNALPKGRIARGLETYTLGMHRAADNLDVAQRENSVILIEKDYKTRYEGFDPRSSESYIMFEFMQDHNMAQSVELAKYVQRRTCAIANRPDKGVKQAGFLVLRETSMPSCLIELGFISTSDEEQFLHSSSGVSLLGQGIYQAFLDYKRKNDPNISVPYKAETQQQINIPAVVPQSDEQRASEERREQQLREKAEREAAERAARDAAAAQAAAEQAAQEAARAAQEAAAAEKAVQEATVAEQTALAQAPRASVLVPQTPEAKDAQGTPIFKVQILASRTLLKTTSSQLKGQTDVDYYQEGGLYKYTVGASSNYNDINRLRKEIQSRFPQAFIIAFKNGQRMDVRQAIQEFKNHK